MTAILIRLDKLLSTQGVATRSETKLLLKKGLITVGGIVPQSTDVKIDPELNQIMVNGHIVTYKQHIYIMMNKPKGVICSTEDRKHQTVIDLLDDEFLRPNLFPAGRLDIDTTGFVLITDDGNFAHNILSPKKHVKKLYIAEIDGELTQEHIDIFANGITIDNGIKCLPADLKVIENRSISKVEIEIMEGKFHQIKRMFEAIQRNVVELHRQKIGNLVLDPQLLPGTCREMLHKEVEKICAF